MFARSPPTHDAYIPPWPFRRPLMAAASRGTLSSGLRIVRNVPSTEVSATAGSTAGSAPTPGRYPRLAPTLLDVRAGHRTQMADARPNAIRSHVESVTVANALRPPLCSWRTNFAPSAVQSSSVGARRRSLSLAHQRPEALVSRVSPAFPCASRQATPGGAGLTAADQAYRCS